MSTFAELAIGGNLKVSAGLLDPNATLAMRRATRRMAE